MPNDEDDSGTFSTASPAQLRAERAAERMGAGLFLELEAVREVCAGRNITEPVARWLREIIDRYGNRDRIVCPHCQCAVPHECP